jgi:DNA-binding SARP family transcriptional activator
MRGPAIGFGLLGPLEVRTDGVVVPVRAPRHRALLAALLCKPNQVVEVDELADKVWDGDPPAAAAVTLRGYVMRLRRALGRAGSRIETSPPGYRIVVDADTELDSAIFSDLLRNGQSAARTGQWADAASRLRDALSLWRGTPLQDVPSEALRSDELPWLTELHAQAIELQLEVRVRSGHGAESIPDLRHMITKHPLREPLYALLMTAFSQCGRRADALWLFRELRSVLSEQLGIEPSRELQELHRHILGARDTPFDRRSASVPRTLPADIGDFTGRHEEVGQLLAYFSGAKAGDSRTVAISSVAGMSGVGKTALAVHVGHRVSGWFPDGQLFAGLRGTASVPVEPGAVLATFLCQLGVDRADLPAGTEERGALYRSVLADRRVLVILDDARDAAQVKPLIPGTPGCAVLVTVRNRLSDLAGSSHLDLEPLSGEDAGALLGQIVGVDRMAGEPRAAGAVLAACGGLPLAIRFVGEHLASRPNWRIEDLADRLGAARRQLDELGFGDDGVRVSFEVGATRACRRPRLREHASSSAHVQARTPVCRREGRSL